MIVMLLLLLQPGNMLLLIIKVCNICKSRSSGGQPQLPHLNSHLNIP